jgi:hypothetical protein
MRAVGSERATMAVLLAACVAYAWVLSTRQPMFGPDSESYLLFQPWRTAGYPLFLSVVGVEGARLLQPALYAGALLVLLWEFLRLSASRVATLGLAATCLLNPLLNEYHRWVLTESLFMSLGILYVALTLRFLRTERVALAAAASALAGLAATVRPTGYALLVPLLVMGWLAMARRQSGVRVERWKVVLLAILPFIALCLGERILSGHVHGEQATSLSGRMLFAKAALIGGGPAPTTVTNPHRHLLESAISDRYQPVRELLSKAPRWDVRQSLAMEYEVCIQWACSDDLRAALPMSEAAKDRLLREVGLAHVMSNPFPFVEMWAKHYLSLWVFELRHHPSAAPVFDRFVAENLPLPFERHLDYKYITGGTKSSTKAAIAQVGLLGLGALTLALGMVTVLAMISPRIRMPLPVLAAGIVSVGIHASMALTAVNIGLFRYTLSAWPMMMVAVFLFGVWLWSQAFLRLPRRDQQRVFAE